MCAIPGRSSRKQHYRARARSSTCGPNYRGCSCSGKKEESDDGSSESRAGDSATIKVAESREEAQDNLGDRIDQLVAEAAKLPRAEFEPAALAATLGKDAQKNFEWVRDHTSWAPYRGLLRGSKGVMLDRVDSAQAESRAGNREGKCRSALHQGGGGCAGGLTKGNVAGCRTRSSKSQ